MVSTVWKFYIHEIVHFLTILRGKLLGNFICKYWRKSQSTGSLKKITVLKNTARWRKSVGTTEKQSIYYKESQVDKELIWIIRESRFWWIWWYFWWNIISFWQILIIKLSDDLFTRISDEVAYQKFWWKTHLSKITTLSCHLWPKHDIIGFHDYKCNLNDGFNEYVKLLLYAVLIAWINNCLFMSTAVYK